MQGPNQGKSLDLINQVRMAALKASFSMMENYGHNGMTNKEGLALVDLQFIIGEWRFGRDL